MKNVLTYVSQHTGDGLLEFVESGSSDSGRRRSLRFEVCAYEQIDKPSEEVMVLIFSISPLDKTFISLPNIFNTYVG